MALVGITFGIIAAAVIIGIIFWPSSSSRFETGEREQKGDSKTDNSEGSKPS